MYLQPQIDPKNVSASQYMGMRTNDRNLVNASTADSNYNMRRGNTQIGSHNQGPEDREPLPKRLKEVKKERVVIIEKGSALCENTGVSHIDLSIEKGKYKLYYLRIENEGRIMPNSRLEVLGSSG